MESIIFVLSLVLISYIGAERAFRVWSLPFCLSNFLHTGIGFIIVGIIVGPLCLDWLDSTRLDLLASPASIVLTWAGLVFGLQFNLRSMRLVTLGNYKIAAIMSLVVFAVVSALLLPIRWIVPSVFVSLSETLPFVFALAAIASVSSPTIAAATTRLLGSHSVVSRMLRYVAASDAVVGVALFGLSLAFFRKEGMAEGAFLPGMIWFVVTVMAGVLLGFVYHVFLAVRLSVNERLAIAVGTVVLSAGVAATMDVSPLFLSMIAGMVLTNFSDSQDRLFRLLGAAEKPLFGLMLILTGAHWLGWEPLGLSLGFAFAIVRALGKALGARMAFRSIRLKDDAPSLFGLALTGQGGMAIAMALDFVGRYADWIGGFLLTAVVTAFFINGIFSPYFIRRLLVAEEGVA